MKYKKISLNTIIYFLILFSIIKPSYLPEAWMSIIYRIFQGVGLFFLLIDYIKCHKRNQDIIYFFLLFYFTILFSTILNSGSLIDLLENFLGSIYIILWFNSVINRFPKKGINILMFVFECVIYLNFISMLLFPNGLYRGLDSITDARYGWLYGHQALLIMYSAPAICVAAVFSEMAGGRLRYFRSVLLSVISIATIFKAGGANGMASIVIILILFIVFSVKKIKKVNFVFFFVAAFVTNVFIVILSKVSLIAPIVTSILHRSLEFTGRRSIWNSALAHIIKHPIFGYGMQNEIITRSHIIAAHAHNMYIHCLYIGGIFALLSYLVFCFVSFNRLSEYTDTFSGKILIATVIMLLFQMIFDVYIFHNIGIIMYCLSFYFPRYYVKDYKTKNKVFISHRSNYKSDISDGGKLI